MGEAIFSYTGLINAVTSFALGAFVLFTQWRSKPARLFSVFSFAVGYWASFYYLWLSATDGAFALYYIRQAMFGAILIPAAFTSFTFEFLEKKKFVFNLLNWLLAALFLVFSFSPAFITAVEPRMGFHFWPVPGPLFHFMLSYFVGNVIVAHTLLWKALGTARGLRQRQIQYVFLGTLLGFIGGSTNYFLWYRIPVPPYLNILVSLYIITVAYAIVRYKLMNIEIVIRRTLVFAGLMAFVFAAFAAATFIAREILSHYLKLGVYGSYAISIFLVVLGYDPIRNLLLNLTDRYLFQKKYDYQKVLKDASRGMARIESLAHLMRLVIHFVTMRIRIKNAAAVILDETYQCFKVAFARGYDGEWNYSVIPVEHSLIKYLSREKEALDLEKVRELQMASPLTRTHKKGDSAGRRDYDFHAIEEKMNELHAACVVPSFLGRELRSILVLGDKKSGDVYSEADLSVLFTLAQESAIAIENARLYDEALNKSRELEKINQQLEEASRRLILALSEAEDANKRLLDTQAQLIHEQKMATLGRLAASVGHEVNNPLTILSMNVSRMILKYRKDPNIRVADVSEYFEKMESNIQRIKAVVNTLTGLLKKSEKGKFEALSLKLVIEETLPLVQFQTYLDNLTGTEVEFDIPANLPLIKGDLERLQEVFLNLFTNAYHALASQKDRNIRVSARVDEGNAKQIVVDFKDNGCGMDEETANRIFNYGYTTKGEGKGSGIGLYMCRYILEIHGGEIKVKSKKGEGTTFSLTLPVYEEQTARVAR